MVADKIKELLKKSKKKQVDIAEYFGLSRSNVADRFKRDTFKARDLIKIADLCSAELCFITKDGEKISLTLDDISKD